MDLKHLKAPMGLISGLVFSALMIIGPGPAAALTYTTYTNSTAFFSALPGTPSILDFETETPGAVVPSGSAVGGINFTYSLDGGTLDLIVSTGFDTVSGANYLGVDDGFDEVFLSGDGFTMTYGGAINAVGLFIIGSPGDVIGGDFELTAGSGSVFNIGAAEATLGDGGDVFFLGIIDTVGFTSATLTSFDPQQQGFFSYTIDDIVSASASASAIPEPGMLELFGRALMGIAVARRRAITASA